MSIPSKTFLRNSAAMTGSFSYRRGILHAENAPLDEIARRFGTPLYVYAAGELRALYDRMAAALRGCPVLLCYALKANFNLAVVRILARAGAGADIVSEGEMRRALQAGVQPSAIIFSGVGKRKEELALALKMGIAQINVESEEELAALIEIAQASGIRAPVALRVNPNVAAGGHEKIATGREGDKFGLPLEKIPEIYRAAAKEPSLAMQGLAVHIGSQILDAAPFREAFGKLAGLAKALRQEGLPVARLDLGGGFAYGQDLERAALSLEDYADLVRQVWRETELPLILEPGRALTASAGILLASVLYQKTAPSGERILVVDAAMNDFLRPALYGASHAVLAVREEAKSAAAAPAAPCQIVGPVCESGDRFASAAPLPPMAAGDLIALMDAGAYGAVMASSYNGRPRLAEIIVSDSRIWLARARESRREMLERDPLPPWLLDERAPSSARRSP